VTRKIVSEMTYNVSNWTLNSTIPYMYGGNLLEYLGNVSTGVYLVTPESTRP